MYGIRGGWKRTERTVSRYSASIGAILGEWVAWDTSSGTTRNADLLELRPDPVDGGRTADQHDGAGCVDGRDGYTRVALTQGLGHSRLGRLHGEHAAVEGQRLQKLPQLREHPESVLHAEDTGGDRSGVFSHAVAENLSRCDAPRRPQAGQRTLQRQRGGAAVQDIVNTTTIFVRPVEYVEDSGGEVGRERVVTSFQRVTEHGFRCKQGLAHAFVLRPEARIEEGGPGLSRAHCGVARRFHAGICSTLRRPTTIRHQAELT